MMAITKLSANFDNPSFWDHEWNCFSKKKSEAQKIKMVKIKQVIGRLSEHIDFHQRSLCFKPE